MADNKLTWTELRRALANRAGVSEKEANSFLNAFNTQLIAALKQDKQVKINGLGMFKLQAVAPRKSVNVTTGEQITIEGYNKLSFVPEAGVKELVESNGERLKAKGEREEIIDPLQKLGAQAEEIVDILGELGQSPVEVPTDKAPSTKEPEKVAEPEPIAEPEKVEVKEEVKEPEAIAEPEKVVEPEPIAEPEPERKKQYHFVRDTLICVVILLALLLVGYFFLRQQISGWIEGLNKPQTEITIDEVTEPEDATLQDGGASQKEAAAPQQEAVSEEAWTYDEILLTESITEGSRLAWIAKKHYGDKAYWPYIYAANKDRIKNPSLITVGTPIRVPKLNAAMRDTTSVRFQQLKEEAYGKVER